MTEKQLNKLEELLDEQDTEGKYKILNQYKKNNIRYEIIYRKETSLCACGPIGFGYEIKFHILDDDSYLYVYADDMNIYSLNTISEMDILSLPQEEFDKAFTEPIECFEGLVNSVNSKYFDLFLEMEKYIDDYKG